MTGRRQVVGGGASPRRRSHSGEYLLKALMIGESSPSCHCCYCCCSCGCCRYGSCDSALRFQRPPVSRTLPTGRSEAEYKVEEVRSNTRKPASCKLSRQIKFKMITRRLVWLVYLIALCRPSAPPSQQTLSAACRHQSTSGGGGFVLLAQADMNANRLYEDLMMTYNRLMKPTRTASEKLTVRLGLKLSQLMEVNLKNQMMTIYLWLNQEWSDYKLRWDPSEYGNITEIDLPAEQIWLPDIVLYNSAEGHFAVSIMTKAKVSHEGYVVWNPPAIFRSSCQIDITHFPFDTQNCHLKFGSWTFGDLIDLRHVNESPPPIDAGTESNYPNNPSRLNEPQKQSNVTSPSTEPPLTDSGQINESSVTIEKGTDLSEYYQNVEWDIMEASAKRNTIKYICCPESYNDVTFHYKLRRKPLFYTVNLIVPCVGITFFSFLVFYLPSDSGEKVTLTISILVSLIFFLSVLIETIPSTSLVMPLLGKYLVFTMILINMSVCATVGVLNIHFRTPSTHSMSPWVKRWCMDILPKYLFMSVPQYQQNNNILPEQLIYLHNQAYATRAVSLPLNQPSNLIGVNSNKLTEKHSAQVSCNMTCCQVASNNNFATGKAPLADQDKHAGMMANPNDHDNTSRSQGNQIGQLHELNAAGLLSVNPIQPRPATFLPHLQSEAARRLQMQRSRSSERDTRSIGDNQPSSSTGNQSASDRHKDELKPCAGQSNQKQDDTSKAAIATKRPKVVMDKKTKCKNSATNPIWRLFGSNREQNSDDHDLSLSREQQQQGQQRLSHSSTTSSNSIARYEDDDDEYQHHRHFQARASICSNNLWRIGPTRRCSLAVPMNNYPTYYRPLAQFQHHRGSGAGCSSIHTISGTSCLPPIVAHYHLHGEESEITSSTESSDETVRYRSGATVGRLINQTTSLVRPVCTTRQQQQAGNSNYGDIMHEMSPITSGGFVANGSQLPRGVNAIPPRRSVSPLSHNSESQNIMPTPPPPLPPSDYLESSCVDDQHNPQAHLFRVNLSQGRFTTVSSNFQQQAPIFDPTLQRDLSKHEHHTSSSAAAAAAAATVQRTEYFAPASQFQYTQTLNQGLGMSKPQQYVQPVPTHLSYTPSNVGFPNVMPNPHIRGDATALTMKADSYRNCHQYNQTGLQCQQQQQQNFIPRSRSTDHRLFGLAQDRTRGGSVLTGVLQSVYQQQQNQYQTLGEGRTSFHRVPSDLVGIQRQQHQSIGRQLGQAYIQNLQRQPTLQSVQQQARAIQTPNRNVRSINGQLRDEARLGEPLAHQTRLANEPSIEMLRRSKSQTSLNRRAPGAANLWATDCQRCNLDSNISNKSNHLPSANRVAAATHCLHRPHSEMRARVYSASNHLNREECCTKSSAQRQNCLANNEIAREVSHFAPASLETMPVGQAGNLYMGNKSCCCDNQKSSQANMLAISRAQPPETISTLNLLKLINEVDKAIQNAMFIAQHIDNLDEFESVKENWKYIAMVIDRICLIMFLFFCIFGTVIIFSMVPWTYYLKEKPIDLDLMRMQALNLTSCDTLKHGCL